MKSTRNQPKYPPWYPQGRRCARCGGVTATVFEPTVYKRDRNDSPAPYVANSCFGLARCRAFTFCVHSSCLLLSSEMFHAVLLVSLTLSTFSLTIRYPQPPQPSPQPSHSKGMTHVALVELGTGCCHQNNATKAAMRAANAAVEWNSIKVRTIIPGSYDAMRLHVQIGVPNPGDVNLDAIASCFPYGTLLPIVVEKGGLLGSSRAGLPADEPVEAHMTVACCCVTVGGGVPMGWDSPAGYLEAEEAEVKRDDESF